MASSPNKVSVIVVTYNSAKIIHACLESIGAQSIQPYEVIVIDNASSDTTLEVIKKHTNITVISNTENLGFGAAINQAAKSAVGDCLALVNPDAILDPTWLEECLRIVTAGKGWGAISGRMYHNKSKKQYFAWQTINPLTGITELKTQDSGELEFPQSLSAAAVLVNKQAFDVVGGFDTDYFLYFEETDLFARMQIKGYVLFYNPLAIAYHPITAKDTSKSKHYYFYTWRNIARFAAKNFDQENWQYFWKRYQLSGIKNLLLFWQSSIRHARAKAFLSNFFLQNKLLRLRPKKDSGYSKRLLHEWGSAVSIVVTNYNYGKYVCEAVDSVLKQTILPKEIVVIDDGSTDDSLKRVQKYHKNSLVRIISQKNAGVTAVKNRAFSEIAGEYVIFLDADDVMPSTYIEAVLVDYLKHQSNKLAMVYTDLQMFGAENWRRKAKHFSKAALHTGNYIHNSALLTKSAIKEVGGYNSRMKSGYEDWELYISLVEAGYSGHYCKNTELFYRRHNGASRNILEQSKVDAIYWQVVGLHPKFYTKFWKIVVWLRLSTIFQLILKLGNGLRYVVQGDFGTLRNKLTSRNN